MRSRRCKIITSSMVQRTEDALRICRRFKGLNGDTDMIPKIDQQSGTFRDIELLK